MIYHDKLLAPLLGNKGAEGQQRDNKQTSRTPSATSPASPTTTYWWIKSRGRSIPDSLAVVMVQPEATTIHNNKNNYNNTNDNNNKTTVTEAP